MKKQLTILLVFFASLTLFMACGTAESQNATTTGDNPEEVKVKFKKVNDKEIDDQIKIGDVVPLTDYKMTGIDGETVTIADAKGENGVLLLFSCNTCPYVIAWEDRYNMIAEHCKANNVGLIVVNSNEAKRQGDDSMEAMKQHAEELKYDFAYVIDTNHQLADAIGAKKTPDLFLFDKDLKLVYKGAIDDNMRNPEKVEDFYIKNAVENMVKGETIDPSVTKAIGCTIKRIKKS